MDQLFNNIERGQNVVALSKKVRNHNAILNFICDLIFIEHTGIIKDAGHPHKHRMLVGKVDTIFADVAQPDQARIVGLNAKNFLKNGCHFFISIKASCIDSTAQPEAVFAAEVKKLQENKLKLQEQITLELYERDHAVVVDVFRPPPKNASG